MIKNREGWKIQLEECSICQKQGKKVNEKGYRKRFYAIEKAEQEKIDAKASNIELTLKQGKASNSVSPQGEIVFFLWNKEKLLAIETTDLSKEVKLLFLFKNTYINNLYI